MIPFTSAMSQHLVSYKHNPLPLGPTGWYTRFQCTVLKMEKNSTVREATGKRRIETREDWERKKQVDQPSKVTHVEGLLCRQDPWGAFGLKVYPKSKRAVISGKILSLAKQLMLFQFIGDCHMRSIHLCVRKRSSDSWSVTNQWHDFRQIV